MSSQFFFFPHFLAQTTAEPDPPQPVPISPAAEGEFSTGQIWIASTVGLAIALVALGVYTKLQLNKIEKALKFEEYKTNSLRKRLKLALNTIKKMETNPDLVHSREFNLDYLRMRMEEEVFRNVILSQLKLCIKQVVSVALRPDTASNHAVGIANSGRKINRTFDIIYRTENHGKHTKGVLFRVQVKLTKLPTQSTSTTINQIIECLERFLSPSEEDYQSWQPTLQGHIVSLRWDQNAKPTPLLIFEQTNQGDNVSFRTTPNRRLGDPRLSTAKQ